MALSTIHVSNSYQIMYDSQGVQISTTSSCLFLSKASISTITNNTSSLSIVFHANPIIFTLTSSQNYLITNIYNSLRNQQDAFGDSSDSE
jgi:hypothetical protein